jgi:hypothetical protein
VLSQANRLPSRRRALPVLRLETRRGHFATYRSAVREQRGWWSRVPSARVANESTPRSIPVSCPVGGRGCRGTSAQEMATYQPSASLEIVIVTALGVPSLGRLQGTAIRPLLASTSEPCSSRTPLPHSVKVKEWEWLPERPLKRGNPAFSPPPRVAPAESRLERSCRVVPAHRAACGCGEPHIQDT